MKINVTLFFLLLATVVFPQDRPLTVAESSNFMSTSTYNDVLGFIDTLVADYSNVRVENIAETVQGRKIPLLVLGNPLPANPDELNGRIAIYIQANIHAGEVEGKEATLMFARDLLQKKNPDILKYAVLLICPNLNADGNERISPKNRTYQNGPVNGVGTRYNGLFMDLNRDAVKLESSEMRGIVQNVLNRWDPYIVMDCHTTDGSYHQEPVTFTWMMNPNGDRNLINYMRDKMMPWVSQTLKGKYKTLNCFYGEFIDQHDYEKGWISYASEPRYFTNYVGIRDRLSILNENYVYAGYRDRVYGCYNLISSVCDYVVKYGSEIKDAVVRADSLSMLLGNSNDVEQDSFAVEYKGVPTPDKVTILTYEAEPYIDDNGYERFRKTDRKRTVTIPYIADYVSIRSVQIPYAYILSINDPKVLQNLTLHGVHFEKLKDSVSISVEQFAIDSVCPILRLNQGHYNTRVYGKYKPTTQTFEKENVIVWTNQKLGRLVATLFEPETEDGYMFWNFWDRYLVPQWGNYYFPVPVYRVVSQTSTAKLKR